MNKILFFDIDGTLLNFDKKKYDFFDWDDNTIHIKKIPLFRINNEQMKIIIKSLG